MDVNVTVATYHDLSAAGAAVRSLENAGIAGHSVLLLARPQEPAMEGDRHLRDRLTGLGIPDHEAQIFADMVEGGDALVVVTTDAGGRDLDRILAVFGESQHTEPLAIFAVKLGRSAT